MAEKCLKCNKKTEKGTGNLIQCDCCSKWEHQKCTYLKNVPDKSLSEIPYYCDVCAIKLQCTMKENLEMKQTIDEMKTMLQVMAEDMKNVRDELSNTSAKVNALDNAQWQSFMGTVLNEINEVKVEIRQLKDKEKTDEINSRLAKVTNELKNVTENIDG